jgi:toxin ParE1/3/4
MRLSITRAAKADIDEIWMYVATEASFEAASRVHDSLSRSFGLLRRHPFAGRSREQDLSQGLRSIPSGVYVVFYRIESGFVRVIRVLHGSRDTNAIFPEE